MPRHPKDIAGSGRVDEAAERSHDIQYSADIMEQVIKHLVGVLRKSGRRGATPRGIRQRWGRTVKAIADQVADALDSATENEAAINPTDLDRLARVLQRLNDLELGWVNQSTRTAETLLKVVLREGVEDDELRIIRSPLAPPLPSGEDADEDDANDDA